MITRQLIILQTLLLLGLGSVFLLPRNAGLGPAGIAMTLPKEFEGWKGTDVPIAKEELAGLAPDTLFVRQTYKNRIGDQIYVSIVLSGEDMVNSIHRPERCLTAQGWTVERSSRVSVPLAGSSRSVGVTRLTSVIQHRPKEGSKTIGIKNLNYYWFIGSRDETASHWTRTFIDSKDRVLHGKNQRWAYVTVAARVMDNLEPGGRDEADTARMVETFIGEIVARFQKPGATSLEDDTTPRAKAPSDAPETPGI